MGGSGNAQLHVNAIGKTRSDFDDFMTSSQNTFSTGRFISFSRGGDMRRGGC